ncbi:DUF882 domain-containing protein [Shimia sp. R9_1]|uniref:D-Ala-D-Ala carboxypeptidase family metallohydrolase n=1 Tax=Shimia sp. R9_1 TaxID=2821111 RepID=UPI001ADD399D|nr:D-Ala-D-Ala carboxypeptidase family metallohydrolase [Shimia sp. R9_1]MBO9408639.1 DUF882 domain-containing protein [Shimia sp. R9_1]
MPLVLTKDDWNGIFPSAPDDVISAFADNPDPLDRVGITENKLRLGYALANVEHECGGFTIKDLTEDLWYSHERIAAVWPNRYPSAQSVRDAFGVERGWQLKAFDKIYGERMGNRSNTNDGSRYIGRGGPQITGRDGYKQVGERAGLDLVNQPELATKAEHQPAILAAFWDWKGLNGPADAGDFAKCVKLWNGGRNGMKDRITKLEGNDPIISRLENVSKVMPFLDKEPEARSSAVPASPVVLMTHHQRFEAFFLSLNLDHFRPSEFAFLGNSHETEGAKGFNLNALPPEEIWPNMIPTAQIMDRLRKVLDASIRLTNVYRNKDYNTAIGGASGSQHMKFTAVDFYCQNGRGPEHWGAQLKAFRSAGDFKGGIGIYPTRHFVHLDTRGTNVDFRP